MLSAITTLLPELIQKPVVKEMMHELQNAGLCNVLYSFITVAGKLTSLYRLRCGLYV